MTIQDMLVGAVKVIQSVSMPVTDLSQKRLQICSTCPERIGARCSVCGCFVEAKVKHQKESCPLHKW